MQQTVQKTIDEYQFCNQNSEQIVDLLVQYDAMIVKYNQQYNIIGQSTLDNFYDRHILDSLSLIKYCEKNLLDFGSGCGIPALILAIFCPEINITMVEKAHSKVLFLEKIIKWLTNYYPDQKIQLLHREVAEINNKNLPLNEYILIARAFKPLPQILRIHQTMSIKQKIAKIVLFKGDKYLEEIKEAQREFHFIYNTSLSLNGKGVIIEIPTDQIIELN